MRFARLLGLFAAGVTFTESILSRGAAQATNLMPLFYNGDTTSADSDHISKQCKIVSNKFSTACDQFTLNSAAINSILENDVNGTQISLFDEDVIIQNEIVTIVNKSYATSNIPNYNYAVFELNTTSGWQGVLVYDNNYKLMLNIDMPSGAVKMQPCPDNKAPADCYVGVKFNQSSIDEQQLKDATDSQQIHRRRLLDTINTTDVAASSVINNFTLAVTYDIPAVSSLGTNNLRINAALMVSMLNQAMINSRIPNIQVILHAAYPYGSTASLAGGNALLSFGGKDIKGADIGALIVKNSNVCGIANLYCNQYSSSVFSLCPYFVVMLDCTEEALEHEFAHLFGCDHDIANAGNSPFVYAHGYINTSTNLRTIMSYPYGSTLKVKYYSTPDFLTDKGYKLGTAGTNNRLVLISQAPIFAAKLHANKPVPELCPKTLVLKGVNQFSKDFPISAMSFKIAFTPKTKGNPKLKLQVLTTNGEELTFSYKEKVAAAGNIWQLKAITDTQIHLKVNGKARKNKDIYLDAGDKFDSVSFAGNVKLVSIKCNA